MDPREETTQVNPTVTQTTSPVDEGLQNLNEEDLIEQELTGDQPDDRHPAERERVTE